MFAVLQASPAVPLDALVEVAQAFTPRFQVMGPFVLLDVGGLSSLFGSAQELGAALQAQQPDCRAVAVASTASAAMLLVCGREGLTVLESGGQAAALAALPLDVLVDVVQARWPAGEAEAVAPRPSPGEGAQPGTIGWRHPRDTHQAQHTRRPRPRPVSSTAHRQARLAVQQCAAALRRWGIRDLGALAALPRAEVHERLGELGVSWQRLARGEDDEPLVPWLAEPVFEETLELEWPVEGFEPLSFVLARLFEPLAARLERADRGAVAIRTALHLTTRQVHLRVLPLPAPMRDPKTLRTLVLLDLESHPAEAPIDRVQVRLEPTPGRVLQWALFERAQPAPEQVATLVARLTALVGEGRVGAPVLVDTWKPGAFAMGEFRAGKVQGSGGGGRNARAAGPADAPDAEWPADTSYRRSASHAHAAPGTPYAHPAPGMLHSPSAASPQPSALARTSALAFRRFRLPIPVRVRVDDGRPVRVTTDRHGVTGGAIVQAAGPWRTSGEWWAVDPSRDEPPREPRDSVGLEPRESLGLAMLSKGPHARPGSYTARPASWDRDEWDIAMADGTVYRLFVERAVGQWFLEGIID